MPIVVDGLTKRFGAVTAVRDLSFTAHPGRVTGFLGRNGAGKSTTLRCLAGLVRPDAGSVTVDGRPFADLAAPIRTVGLALDPEAHHPDRTGRNHLLVIADAAGLPASRVDEVLAQVELDTAGNRRAGGYSLGMRQRLHLAAALLGEPGTLVLDEPANGLDPQGVRWLRDLLRSYAAAGNTVLLSSHQLTEVAQTVDDVVVIAAGALVTAGPLADLLTEETPRLLVRSDAGEPLAALVRDLGGTVDADGDRLRVTGLDAVTVARAALDARLLITELTPLRPDIEQRFLALTES